jgi:hypothetical protein
MITSVSIKAKTLDECYFQLLEQTYKYGRVNNINEGSFKGHNRIELDCVNAFIEYPSTRPLAPIFPSDMTPVTTDEKIEEYFVNYLMDSNLSDNEHYKYATWITGGRYNPPVLDIIIDKGKDGERPYGIPKSLVNDKNIIYPYFNAYIAPPNQLEWIINHYNTVGLYNNHCCVKIGYPESILAYSRSYTNETDRPSSPCLTIIDTKIVKDGDKNKLLLFVNFRSNDLYSAFPENIGGIILLGEYICGMLNEKVELGGLFYTSLKCHCYDFQIDFVKKRLNI